MKATIVVNMDGAQRQENSTLLESCWGPKYLALSMGSCAVMSLADDMPAAAVYYARCAARHGIKALGIREGASSDISKTRAAAEREISRKLTRKMR